MSYIIGLARTPFSPVLGALVEESSIALGATALNGALSRSLTSRNRIDRLVLSQVFSAGAGSSPARQISINTGLPSSTRCFQTSQLCTSGLKAISIAKDALDLRKSQLTSVVGAESTSQAPFLLTKARAGGYGVGDDVLVDSVTSDGFTKMGIDVDSFTKNARISKLEMVQYAAESFRRAAACYSDGIMQIEIAPVIVKNKRSAAREGEAWISHPHTKLVEDTLPRHFVPKHASASTIKTKSTMADGACSLLLCDDGFLRESGATPFARILDCCELSTDSDRFPDALTDVIRECSRRVNSRIDIYDINDQYAFLPIYVAKALNIDHSRINVHGSTIAIGHPMGRCATGIRQIISLVTALRSQGLQYGCAAGANAVGDAIAVILEVP
ncbi:thiolase, N-terminal and C-terminal domain containing protein, putative [Babesia bigemina]|uniref:Thiolase, N-terminal and C-terminal domain containing protein, putative n=1 Tax=Babesia bigemina TaxID=5866 RepID=A0A061D5X4_BABBI|nr:thiolase, N-terminal and C-terminal domain containing protein, putative [Babesia bigemina]CDR95417.1 thiolase, N-terminal and C-terminal domain containing protein, putative [Babesia bigemina]|eukprot:XP_012767603.1 thiolase, N-terminal and C-terminal domain containing protein, putative [Babesia bigemina]